MSFLNPAFFALLAPLLALPLLIHLFNRKFPNTVPFPDVSRIKRSLSERSRLMRWRHWLMTFLRTLAVACALLAFLKPVLPKLGSDAAVRDGRRLLLILDRSPSMVHRSGAATSASKNALAEAGKILDTLGSGDSANVILAGSSAKLLLSEFEKSADTLRSGLAALPPSYEALDVKKAITLAASVLLDESQPSEIYLLSDFQRTNWAATDFRDLPGKTRLFFVDLAESERENAAILSLRLTTDHPVEGEVVGLDLEIANWASEARVLPVETIIDDRYMLAGEISLAPWSAGKIQLEFQAPGPGSHAIVSRIPEDGLAADNFRYATFEVREREEVPILTDRDPEESGAVFLKTALNPFEEGGAFSPRILPSEGLDAARISSISRITLTGVDSFSPELSTRFTSFLEQGGGALYFLNGPSDQENLLAIEESAGRPALPFHVAGALTVENFGGKPLQIARGDFESPLLQLFAGENRQVLALLEFYEVQRAIPTGEGEVLLSFADGTPALGIARVGLGTLVVCNFTPAELTSNLARQRLFPAWIHEMVKNLVPETLPQRSFEVGALLTAGVWKADFESGPILTPSGKTIMPRVQSDGHRINASFLASEPGFYQLGQKANPAWREAVNVSAHESDLRAIEISELENRAAKFLEQEAHSVTGAEDYTMLRDGRPVFHWFLVALAALLLVEMLLQKPFQKAAGS